VIFWQLGDPKDVGRLIIHLDPNYIVFILIVNTFDRALMSFKWGLLLRGRGLHLPLFLGLKIYCASMIWGMFLPSTVGADAIRATSTARRGLDANEVVASIVVERMLGFLAALLLCLFSLLLLSGVIELNSWLMNVWWALLLLIIGFIGILMISFSHRLFDTFYDRFLVRVSHMRFIILLRKVHETYLDYQANKKSLLIFFGLTFFEQFFSIINAWMVAKGLGINASFAALVGAIPLSILISRLPISVEGLGVFEGVLIFLMSLTGISAAEAISISIVSRVLHVVTWMPWWLSYSFESKRVTTPDVA
jgi:uncharacterized protein (TIRG00374 family)